MSDLETGISDLQSFLDLLSRFGFMEVQQFDTVVFGDLRNFIIEDDTELRSVRINKGIGFLGTECEFRFEISTGKFLMHGIWQ